MEIKSLKLTDVGQFGDMDIQFAPTLTHRSNITVLAGNNGSGKTTILKSLNICLSWLIAKIRSNNGKGKYLIHEDIRNGASGAVLSIGITDISHPRTADSDTGSENEDGISDTALAEIAKKFGTDSDAWKTLTNVKVSTRDRQLTAVRSALNALMPDFTNLRLQRKPHLHMAVDKHGATFSLTQLSLGEKSMIALVGDMARRLAMMNPSMDNPLHGDDIVLIDEVELRMDPQWQLGLIAQLSTTFPNCQFVLTTRSPLVVSDTEGVLVYLLHEGDRPE